MVEANPLPCKFKTILQQTFALTWSNDNIGLDPFNEFPVNLSSSIVCTKQPVKKNSQFTYFNIILCLICSVAQIVDS